MIVMVSPRSVMLGYVYCERPASRAILASVLRILSLSHSITVAQTQQRTVGKTLDPQRYAIFSKASKEAKTISQKRLCIGWKSQVLAHCRALHVPSPCTFHGRSSLNKQAFLFPCSSLLIIIVTFHAILRVLRFIIIRNTRSSRQSRRLLLFRVRRPCHGPSYPTQDSFFFGQAEKRKKKTKQKNDDVTVCCQDLASSWHSLTGRCIAGMRASG